MSETATEGAAPLLRVEGLRKRYGRNDVLAGIDLSMDTGEVVCLIGSSGSGKSTLLRCLDLLERVDDGTIWFEGVDVTDPRINPDVIRSRIGLVFQAYNLFPHVSVLGNVTMAPRRVHGRGRREAQDEALALLERFGLAAKARAFPDSLSGGQQQRVALVRAVATRPRLLLLDEVTSALDPELVGEVLSMVAELKNEGMTMLIATHELSFARDVADRVCFLHAGAVHEQGPALQLLDSPREPRTRDFLRRFHAR
ncbi:MAG TPA: amino acid ABC transporter ATP-binding protein [Nocardioidaceae bacterium]|jgi:polar amino acid transport system ATP-binding protein|nr:amino acid ABC transporter ATP-binding protein [Nocardioidaceae bacterium]